MLRINVNKGEVELTVEGNITEVVADVTCALQAIYETMDEDEDSDLADLFRMGVMFAITSGLVMHDRIKEEVEE